MATGKLVKRYESHRRFDIPATLVFAVFALAVSIVAVAFSVGRHFPISPSVDMENTRALATSSSEGRGLLQEITQLKEITQRAAIAYDRLKVDRGSTETSSYETASNNATVTSATQQARRGNPDDN